MTFEEWWEREDRVYLNEYSTFKMVALQAWKHQQERINELEVQLEIEDIRPMGESEYLERIETLKDELEDKCRTINNMRITIADLTEKLDIERNKGRIVDTQKEHNRFELEQVIMSCWGITDDLHLLADAMEAGENKRMQRTYVLEGIYEICPECSLVEGKHKLDCSYGR